MQIKKTKYYSYKIGNLAKGCQLCVQGKKLVLFVTGLCPRSCYFCPISDKKYKKDVTYADEWPTEKIDEIIKEAELIGAKGAGFTGGDPLCKLDRVIFYLKKLKQKFGKKFHVHLYTSLDLVNERNMKKLYEAGLDEIRIHLDLDSNRLRQKISFVLAYDWDIGVEIPVIPKKDEELKKIILFINSVNKSSANKIKFLNLNELEVADNKINTLSECGYVTKNSLSYAVKGSEELALKLLKFVENKKIKMNVHYCTATLKDRVQMANRVKRRAKNTKKEYDLLTEDGTFVRGAIYFSDLKPGFDYRNKLEKISKNNKIKKSYLKKLNKIKNDIKKDFKIKDNLISVDETKLRILTSVKLVNKIKDDIDKNLLKNVFKDKRLLGDKELYLAVVEEYPSYDQLELNVEFL